MIRDKVISILIGAILSGLGALALGIYSDFVPALMPALRMISAETYIKIILLLFVVLLLVSAVAIVLWMKRKPFRPLTMSGKIFAFKWSAEIKYNNKGNDVEISLQWLCPKHSVFLGIKSAEIPETTYYNLWCRKCGHVYQMKSRGDPVYVQEAEEIVRRQILKKLKL